jgi:hypothetical protein
MSRRPSETIQVNLRIKESLRRELSDAAKKYERSFNAEIIERIRQTVENEELRREVAKLTQWLNAVTRKQEREAPVIAGWIANELRQRGLDEKNIKELAEIIRVYLGGRFETEKE